MKDSSTPIGSGDSKFRKHGGEAQKKPVAKKAATSDVRLPGKAEDKIEAALPTLPKVSSPHVRSPLAALASPFESAKERSGGRERSGETSGPDRGLPRCTDIEAVYTAPREPSVTLASLSELDTSRIFSNPSLRLDINFDSDLHFRPNDSARAVEKHARTAMYWQAILAELRGYDHDDTTCHNCLLPGLAANVSAAPEPRLPRLIATIKEVVESLVPQRDKDQVAENIDVELVLQQLSHGVFHATRFACWLENLLTSHCAPMRDELIAQATGDIAQGLEGADMAQVVRGLEALMASLEFMKLDVANHQIRVLRPQLIDHSLAFLGRLAERKIQDAPEQYKAASQWFAGLSTGPASGAQRLMTGLSQACGSDQKFLPVTFALDGSRIAQLQTDVHGLVERDILLAQFDTLARRRIGPAFNAEVFHRVIERRILALTRDAQDGRTSVLRNVGSVSLELQRVVDLAYLNLTPLRQSNAPEKLAATGDVWPVRGLNGKCAVRRGRRRLQSLLERENRSKVVERRILATLSEKAWTFAQAFMRMNASEMAQAQGDWLLRPTPFLGPPPPAPASMATGRLMSSAQTAPTVPEPGWPVLEEMSRRLAHMGVINWKVWSGAVYQNHAWSEESDAGAGT